jgi:hypothetical protein
VLAIFVESSKTSVMEEVALEISAAPIIKTAITTKNNICLVFVRFKNSLSFPFTKLLA